MEIKGFSSTTDSECQIRKGLVPVALPVLRKSTTSSGGTSPELLWLLHKHYPLELIWCVNVH
jgi:hypothetical protein